MIQLCMMFNVIHSANIVEITSATSGMNNLTIDSVIP